VAAILVVDPDVKQAETARAAIESAGHEPVIATTAERGVDILREGGIDLAVIHYTDGMHMEIIAKGLERLPDPPPFLLVSSAVDAPSKSAHYGAAEFVATPYSKEELLAVIARVLAERNAPHEFEEVPTRPNEKKGEAF
jgi:DNA-binding NtrC family response regulator